MSNTVLESSTTRIFLRVHRSFPSRPVAFISRFSARAGLRPAGGGPGAAEQESLPELDAGRAHPRELGRQLDPFRHHAAAHAAGEPGEGLEDGLAAVVGTSHPCTK